MRTAKTITLVLALTVFTVSLALAGGDAERGKALFNDPGFAGGKRACASCHPEGGGLEEAAGKETFSIMGSRLKGLRAAVNFCIVNASKGRAINESSREMDDIVAYIESLGKKAGAASGGEAAGYGVPKHGKPAY